MADIIGNIQLRTTGGDQASSEVAKATTALNSMTSASSGLEHQFQHRFQHIGLMLFAGDALRASGLGAETRQVIGGLNTALMAGEAAFGAAAGPAFLFVAALTAIAGIAIKVIEHHKNLADSLGKVVKSEQDAYEKTLDNIELIKKYNEVVGGAGGLLEAEKKLAALQQGELLTSQMKQLAALQSLLQSNITHAQIMSLLEDSYDDFKEAIKRVSTAIDDAIRKLPIIGAGYSYVVDKVKSLTSALHLNSLQYPINAKEASELAKKQAEVKERIEALRISIQHGSQDWHKFMKSAVDAFGEVRDGLSKTDKGADETAKRIAENLGKAAQMVGSTFGSIFAGVIVEGKDMGEEMSKAAQKMAEKFIESTIEMIIYWTAFRAIMEVFGQHAAFVTAAHAAYPMIASNIYGQAADSFTSHATGGEMFADQPTLALFGEGGPERATFTPLSGGNTSSGSGGGDVYIGSVNTTVTGVNNPDEIARKVGQKIVQQIRGQGQINFTRS